MALWRAPENSDKLAQRNLQLTFVDNPGPAATHRVSQTFDLKPGQQIAAAPGDLLDYPDELMIDWGNTPPGSAAHIYWPQISAKTVLNLANRLYSTHLLSASDANTITTTVIRGVTYVPIPAGTEGNIAGLFTLDLPMTITVGQEFNIVVRRVATRRVQILEQQIPIPDRSPNAATANSPAIKGSTSSPPVPIDKAKGVAPVAAPTVVMKNWRYVTGTFQVKIPVTTDEVMLRSDEDALAITKWRLQGMAASNRWENVLKRHAAQVGARLEGLGVDPDSIPPSPDGAPLEIFSDGTGSLEIKFVDAAGGPVSDLADVFLQHQELSDQRVIRRWPTTQVLVVNNLISTDTGIYELQVLPDHHDAVGQFVTINEDEATAVQLVLRPED